MLQRVTADAPPESPRQDVAILEALLEHSENALVYLDCDFNFVRVNRAYAEMCRREPEDFVGRNHFELYPHEENQRIFQHVRDTRKPAIWREKPFVFPDAPERGITYWDWMLAPVSDAAGSVPGLVLSLVDVTNNVLAREAIRQSEARLRAMLGSSPDAVYRRSLAADRYLYVSPAIERITGYSIQEFSSWSFDEALSHVHPDDLPALRERLDDSGKPKSGLLEYRLRCKDGSYRWIGDRCSISHDEEGRPLLLDGCLSDITERKRAEGALRESEERFRVMADGAPIIIWVTDPEGGVWFTNRRYREFFGVTHQDVEGRKWQPLVHPEDAPGYLADFRRAVRERAPFGAEVRVRRADGVWRWVISSAEPRRSADGEFMGHVGMCVDITARKRLEEEVRSHAAELETLMDVVPVGLWISKDPHCHSIVGNRMANQYCEAEAGENVSATPPPGQPVPGRRFCRSDCEMMPDELPMQTAIARNIDVRSSEFDLVTPSGVRRTLWGNASPLRDEVL